MAAEPLFQDAQGRAVTGDSLKAALEQVGAHDCRVLFMHTGLSFGLPNPALTRVELLDRVYQAVRGLSVATLCVPTYTFSFCNGEDYDSLRSHTRMGALNEYIRRRPEAVRSVDPLMSAVVVGEDRDLVENLGHESIGAGSTFDKLSRKPNVKFLFLGVRLGDCFTYMHHLEWTAGVAYRYNRKFTGRITHSGTTYLDSYWLFVRYNNVKPNRASYTYERSLSERGLLRMAPLGDTSIGCIAEPDARASYLELLGMDRNHFIERPFRAEDADPTFLAHGMVAL
jgi:aminoglycoside 3-N-acetyltransferase